VVRPYDSVARVDSAEFMVLLPKTALEAAHLTGERIRTAVAGASFESGNQRLSAITVSIGVAQSGHDGETMDAILRAADARLRDAKQQGRNRVIAA
jgi:diguanylate cyclase (GGDEF)-like protein